MQTIIANPTWSTFLPAMLDTYAALYNQPTRDKEQQQSLNDLKTEFKNMAKAADEYNKFCSESEETVFGFSTLDVQEHADQLGYRLTKTSANEILAMLGRKGDLSTGISWETLSYFIEQYASENEIAKHLKKD